MTETAWCRRPITSAEVPYLATAGARLRAARVESGLLIREVAERAAIGANHVSAIERGKRRTRRSTLARIVTVLVDDDDNRRRLLAELVDLAGPALAPESAYQERVAKRRRERSLDALTPKLAALRKDRALLLGIAAGLRRAGSFDADTALIVAEQLAGIDEEIRQARLEAEAAAAAAAWDSL